MGVYMHRSGVLWVAVFAVIALMFLHLPPMAAKQDSVLHTYSALVEVDALARQKFVEPIEGDLLVDGAIRGMMFQLDPYSGYIAPDELHAFERRSRGEFDGIGLELGMHRGRLTVIAPIEGSPAARAGVLAGDEILSVNGEDLTERSVFDVEEMLAGPVGTTVDIVVRHRGGDSAHAVTVVRGHVSIRSVRGFRHGSDGLWDYMINPEDGIAYVRVSSFRNNTLQDFDKAVLALLRRGVRALILDLRFNPGGLMKQAVAMVDRFVDEGLILSTVTRRRAIDVYAATPVSIARDVVLVVLINGSSASSAEIVAGSLQARGRATLVGERTFGKGSVQHLIPLSGHRAAIKLTVAYYRLPDGRIIHRTDRDTGRLTVGPVGLSAGAGKVPVPVGEVPANARSDDWGVRPDVEVVLSDKEMRAIQDSRWALDSASSQSTMDTGPAAAAVSAPADAPQLIRDRQLVEALALARQALATAED